MGIDFEWCLSLSFSLRTLRVLGDFAVRLPQIHRSNAENTESAQRKSNQDTTLL